MYTTGVMYIEVVKLNVIENMNGVFGVISKPIYIVLPLFILIKPRHVPTCTSAPALLITHSTQRQIVAIRYRC